MFNFEPIDNPALIPLYYIIYTSIGIAAAYIVYKAVGTVIKVKIGLADVLLGVPLEEVLFRGLPLILLGEKGVVAFHFLWALLHINPPTVVFAFIHGILYVRLWLSGMWHYAIIIHVLHDLAVLMLSTMSKKKHFGGK